MGTPYRWLAPTCFIAILASSAGLAEVGEQKSGVVIAADGGEKLTPKFGGVVRLKVGPQNSGATQLMVGTMEMPSGTAIPTHRHDKDEEVLYIVAGEVVVTLGNQELRAKTGDTVFIPVGTWMTVRNQGKTMARLLAVIPRAEMEACMRMLHGEGKAPADSSHEAIHNACQTSVPPASDSK